MAKPRKRAVAADDDDEADKNESVEGKKSKSVETEKSKSVETAKSKYDTLDEQCDCEPVLYGSFPGRPIQVVSANVTVKKRTFELNIEALESILLQKAVRDKRVVVVSVAGAYRKGKSFLLDFLIRYLRSQGKNNWMGDENAPLTGFTWRGGSERDTTGIVLWSEIFLVPLPNGKEVGVVLMDTQGTFDNTSTVKDCATIFALSTMLSSVQVFNISQNIQEDDLQHLQLFTEYGRLALENTGDKPFQKLQFLVRDWSYPYEYQYGLAGGQEILDKKLKVSQSQHEELQQLRKHIHSCFHTVECFLMPHPGLNVATNPMFDGRLVDIESDFKEQLNILVPSILAPENLIIKKVNGKAITSGELLEYFKAYIKIYQRDVLPEPKTMLLATAEANNLAAINSAKNSYTKSMDSVCGGDKPYMNIQTLETEHFKIKDRALLQFRNTPKMGGDDFSKLYEERLNFELEESFANYKLFNESKNVFLAFRTPTVLFILVICCYVMSSILGMMGLYMVANMTNLGMGLALFLLCLWCYIRYSGDLREIGMQIDGFACTVWEAAMKPVYIQVVHPSHIVSEPVGSLISSRELTSTSRNFPS